MKTTHYFTQKNIINKELSFLKNQVDFIKINWQFLTLILWFNSKI